MFDTSEKSSTFLEKVNNDSRGRKTVFERISANYTVAVTGVRNMLNAPLTKEHICCIR